MIKKVPDGTLSQLAEALADVKEKLKKNAQKPTNGHGKKPASKRS